jgi:hypothetical protein
LTTFNVGCTPKRSADCAIVESADHICHKNGMILISNASVWWQLNSNVEKIVEIMDALQGGL